MKISKNIGGAGRTVRIVGGIGLLLLTSLALLGPGYGWALIGLIGVAPLAAGLVGYCPTFVLLGIESADDEDEHTRRARC